MLQCMASNFESLKKRERQKTEYRCNRAPAIEDQAVDRVHRLGQTKPTTVFRLVMEKTIEERVIDIQQEKRKLMMLAFAEKASKRGRQNEARLADIQRLLQ
jgi:SWI/SNF-related matrix-associated actin-dependent regulator of chromatin subfamily A3